MSDKISQNYKNNVHESKDSYNHTPGYYFKPDDFKKLSTLDQYDLNQKIPHSTK